jgi:hypothetical protein
VHGSGEKLLKNEPKISSKAGFRVMFVCSIFKDSTVVVMSATELKTGR